MEAPRYGIPCNGEPCDRIGLARDSHCHMPPQERLPNNLTVSPEAAALAEQLLRHSVDGRLGDEDQAWEALELERLERSLGEILTPQVSELEVVS